MKGSGGTDGGFFLFGAGFLLSAGAAWFLFDSVIAQTGHGVISGFLRGRAGAGMGRGFGFTTSMGVLFVPFMVSVVALFYDATKKWAWWLMYAGLAIIAIEIISHLRFTLSIKTSNLILILGMFAAGLGLMLRSYRDTGQTIDQLVGEGAITSDQGAASESAKEEAKEVAE